MKIARTFLLLGSVAALLLPRISAGIQNSSSTVNFHGYLSVASCSADAIDVDFGDVALNTITEEAESSSISEPAATGNSIKAFTLAVRCKGYISNGIQYRFDSAPAAFLSSALPTDTAGLGVVITNLDGSKGQYTVRPQTLYTLEAHGWEASVLNASKNYKMSARLVRDPAAKFSGGKFSSITTLTMQLP